MLSMRRRDFITLIGGAAAAWPCNGLAQSPPKRPLIGFLGASSKAAGARYYGGFALGMRELGYLDGRDYGFEDRYGDGDGSRLPSWPQKQNLTAFSEYPADESRHQSALQLLLLGRSKHQKQPLQYALKFAH
jgi:hypothetical protein